MFFGKKATNDSGKNPTPLVAVTTIPPEFYAGQNPIVKFKDVKKEITVKKPVVATITPTEKKLLDKTTVAGSGNKFHPANLLSNRKFLIIGISVLFVIFIVGGIAYYWFLARSNEIQTIPTPPKVEQPVEVIPSTTPEVIIEATTTVEVPPVTEPVSLQPPPLNFPSILSGDSADLDKDDITDKAEELFKTDPSVPDTDGDSFPDGHEIFYLYSPINKTPTKLIDSNLITDFDNPAFGYKVYYPADWAVGSVDAQYQQVLFSTLSGENIEVRLFGLDLGISFDNWFTQYAVGERLSDLKPFESRFGETGFGRSDNLVFYLVKDNQVAVIIYHNVDNYSPVNYRIVAKMMARSFRFVNNNIVLPIQQSASAGMPTTSEQDFVTTTL